MALKARAERDDLMTRGDLIAAMTAYVVAEFRTMNLDTPGALARVQAEVPGLLEGAIDHPEAFVLLSFTPAGMLCLVSDLESDLAAFVKASKRSGGHLLGLNPSRVKETMRAMKIDAARAADLGGRYAVH
jgi:hypothetical protein